MSWASLSLATSPSEFPEFDVRQSLCAFDITDRFVAHLGNDSHDRFVVTCLQRLAHLFKKDFDELVPQHVAVFPYARVVYTEWGVAVFRHGQRDIGESKKQFETLVLRSSAQHYQSLAHSKGAQQVDASRTLQHWSNIGRLIVTT